MRTFPTEQDVQQFIERASSGQFTAQDLDAFYKKPQLWRPPSSLPTPEDAQTFWQMVWDELALEIGGRIIVPPLPRLTDKQRRSIAKYRLLVMYLPGLSEDRYPECFVKPDWARSIIVAKIEYRPLRGRWIGVETISKPHQDDPEGYAADLLMAAVERAGRFTTSWDDLHGRGLMGLIAKATGFPKKGTRLPTAEEWNLVGNFFNWLREHRSLDLPDLGSTRSWEWCENAYGPEGRLFVGHSGRAGLADVDGHRQNYTDYSIGFRVLFEL
jgi:hypothetical protein